MTQKGIGPAGPLTARRFCGIITQVTTHRTDNPNVYVQPGAVSSRGAGFTLLELLTVVAIVAILLGIFAPGLPGLFELTRRAVCRSLLQKTGQAHIIWANNHDGQYVEGQPVYFNTGHYACWFRGRTAPAHHAEYGPYTKHAVLVHQGYLPDGKIFYCPSWSFPSVQYGVSAREFNLSGGYGRGGGWFEDPADVPAGQVWMQTSYHYNCTFSAKADPRIPDMRSARTYDSCDLPLMVDAFSDPNRGVDWHHGDGYNVLRLDGATFFHRDPDYAIRDRNGGVTYHYGTVMYEVHQAWVWKQLVPP